MSGANDAERDRVVSLSKARWQRSAESMLAALEYAFGRGHAAVESMRGILAGVERLEAMQEAHKQREAELTHALVQQIDRTIALTQERDALAHEIARLKRGP